MESAQNECIEQFGLLLGNSDRGCSGVYLNEYFRKGEKRKSHVEGFTPQPYGPLEPP